MSLFSALYEKYHHKPAPYYMKYSLLTMLLKGIRKFVAQVLAPNCPINCVRIWLYRLCGFKIGKHTFIGMRCYLDDMCYDLMTIGNNCIISYGVYFACHGYNQGHYPLVIEDNVYIGMRACVMSKNAQKDVEPAQGVTIHTGAVIGSCTLVNKNIPAGATAVGIPCKIIHTPINKEAQQ